MQEVQDAGDYGCDSWVGKIPWRRDGLPTPVFIGFPGGSDGKESTCNVGDLGSIPGSGRSPGGGRGNPFQYSCLEGYSPWGHKVLDMTGDLARTQAGPGRGPGRGTQT